MCRKLLEPEAPLSKKNMDRILSIQKKSVGQIGKKKNTFTNYGLSYSEFPEGLSACMFDFDRGEQP